jgi:ankyrin repeat protein
MIAIRGGDLDVFRLLLARGANVDAIYQGRGESVHTMSIPIGLRIRRMKVAANGYPIDEGQGGSALEVAGGRHAHTMFNELLARGVDVTANGSAAVVACAGAGNTTGLLALLDRGANMHIQQGVPGKALHEAARCLHIGTVKVLLERGVDVNSFGGVHG